MNKIKKALKLLALVCLLLLAGIGIGIGGAVPIPLSRNRWNAEIEQTAIIEEEDKSDSEQILILQIN